MPFNEINSKGSHPVKVWSPLDKVDSKALAQLKNIAALPFVFKHVAVMPDVHVGIGATVGTVIATRDALIPAAVGVDIGCGMMAVRTRLDARRVQDDAGKIRSRIEAAVPVGFASNRDVEKSVSAWSGWKTWDDLALADKDLKLRARLQLGSLGGGNHFIELCVDQEGSVWIMLHSGSRNVGKTLAERHMHSAKKRLRDANVRLADMDLAWVEEGSEEFAAYLGDLQWCQAYAFQNRQEMMARIMAVLADMYMNGEALPVDMKVNCHHNYAVRETHFGEQVWVTRKGAVRAAAGDLGIIPGSMGARSFIVRGLGSAESFHSCSHGAGRVLSRTEAKKRFSVKDLVNQTEGVESRKDHGVLDEIPAAYKDIDEVMANQTDLVEPLFQLKQFLCVKG
jgi:tRNA-splicing ligase RtcB (3'-phosphate/5'-hydroxy nucleic acid ligase)